MAKKKSATESVNDGKFDGMFYKSPEDFKRVYQETGITGFDLAISNGQGLPVGGCILMYSAPGSGKSTLCVEIANRILRKNEAAGLPYKCLFLDIEGGSDGLAQNTHLMDFASPTRGRRLLYKPAGGMTWNDLEEMFKCIENETPPFDDVRLVIIDSLNSIQSEAQADRKKKINSGDFGTSAKDRYNLYNKYVLNLKSKGVTFLFISQQRQKQGATMFEDQKKAATADGDDHIVDCILKLSRNGGGNNAETKKVDVISAATGEKAKIATQFFCNVEAPKKNRFYAGLPKVPMLVKIGKGIVNAYTLRNILLTYHFMKVAGTGVGRTVTMVDELLTFVGNSYPFEQGSKLPVANKWIADNNDGIIEFLKSKGKYTLVEPAENTEEDFGDNDTDNEDDNEEETVEEMDEE